jgi:RNA polymerase sigma factor (sigma-70 family)
MQNLELAKLYQTEQPKLLRYCYAITKCQEDAEDASEKAFCALMTNDIRGNQTAWLYKAAYNASIDIIRLRQTECQLSPNCHEIPEQDEPFQYDCLHNALRTLPARESMAVWLRYWVKLSYAEIGAKMGVSEKAVDCLLFRAKNHLREMISKIEAA